jgi:hypothetical protein
MAPYAAMYRGSYANGVYGNDASLPLLADSGGFNGDMVFANRQVRTTRKHCSAQGGVVLWGVCRAPLSSWFGIRVCNPYTRLGVIMARSM